MALYRLSVRSINRTNTRTVVAKAAKQAGVRLRNEATRSIYDQSRRRGVDCAEILAPEGAPAWALDRGQLWNQVERADSPINATLAREIQLSLPVELDTTQQRELVRDWVQQHCATRGMVADVALHDLASANPRAVVLLTTRVIEAEGFGRAAADWAHRDTLLGWRSSWAGAVNQALVAAGSHARVDHRSLRARGIDLAPLPMRYHRLSHEIARSRNAQRCLTDVAVALEALFGAQDVVYARELELFVARYAMDAQMREVMREGMLGALRELPAEPGELRRYVRAELRS